MIDFRDIKAAVQWSSVEDEAFIRDLGKTEKEIASRMIRERGYRHTSCHGRVSINPLVFESGQGSILKDADGNRYLDLGSGIYVTNLGHSHPKVSEAVSRHAKTLMNCHDYMTPVKAAFLERLAGRLGGDLKNIHLYDNGTTAVEFAIRAARTITGRHEIISFFSDHHGKTYGSAALGRLTSSNGPARPSGFHLVPRPDPYRPVWTTPDGKIDTDAYIAFYEQYIKEATTGLVAAFVLEPIQGWGGTIIPPDDFLPKLARLCKTRGMLLVTDEILTGSGRTGKWLSADWWGVRPDITVLGKGLGNGFPMSALVVKEEHAWALPKIAPSTTFGGNPMACAAGLATIEAIEEEGAMELAVENGGHLLGRLKELKEAHPIIGDVRGKGCLLGVEFVWDRETKKPFVEAASEIYAECLKRKLIPGVPVLHLLRLAPQLTIRREMLDTAVAILDDSIGKVEEKFGMKGGRERMRATV